MQAVKAVALGTILSSPQGGLPSAYFTVAPRGPLILVICHLYWIGLNVSQQTKGYSCIIPTVISKAAVSLT